MEAVFGEGSKSETIKTETFWSKLKELYNVFHIKKPAASARRDISILKQWTKTLAEVRVMLIKSPKACIDVMLGAIALSSGARTMEGYITDMKNRGQSQERIEEITQALKLYAEKIARNEIKIVRHQVSKPLQNINNET